MAYRDRLPSNKEELRIRATHHAVDQRELGDMRTDGKFPGSKMPWSASIQLRGLWPGHHGRGDALGELCSAKNARIAKDYLGSNARLRALQQAFSGDDADLASDPLGVGALAYAMVQMSQRSLDRMMETFVRDEPARSTVPAPEVEQLSELPSHTPIEPVVDSRRPLAQIPTSASPIESRSDGEVRSSKQATPGGAPGPAQYESAFVVLSSAFINMLYSGTLSFGYSAHISALPHETQYDFGIRNASAAGHSGRQEPVYTAAPDGGNYVIPDEESRVAIFHFEVKRDRLDFSVASGQNVCKQMMAQLVAIVDNLYDLRNGTGKIESKQHEHVMVLFAADEVWFVRMQFTETYLYYLADVHSKTIDRDEMHDDDFAHFQLRGPFRTDDPDHLETISTIFLARTMDVFDRMGLDGRGLLLGSENPVNKDLAGFPKSMRKQLQEQARLNRRHMDRLIEQGNMDAILRFNEFSRSLEKEAQASYEPLQERLGSRRLISRWREPFTLLTSSPRKLRSGTRIPPP